MPSHPQTQPPRGTFDAEGDKLLGGGRGFAIEFVPLSDLPDLGALDEQPAEFTRQAYGRTVFLFHGQPLGVKK